MFRSFLYVKTLAAIIKRGYAANILGRYATFW